MYMLKGVSFVGAFRVNFVKSAVSTFLFEGDYLILSNCRPILISVSYSNRNICIWHGSRMLMNQAVIKRSRIKCCSVLVRTLEI